MYHLSPTKSVQYLIFTNHFFYIRRQNCFQIGYNHLDLYSIHLKSIFCKKKQFQIKNPVFLFLVRAHFIPSALPIQNSIIKLNRLFWLARAACALQMFWFHRQVTAMVTVGCVFTNTRTCYPFAVTDTCAVVLFLTVWNNIRKISWHISR